MILRQVLHAEPVAASYLLGCDGKSPSTIGIETRNNRAFRIENDDEVIRMMVADIPPVPPPPAAAQARAMNSGHTGIAG